MIWVPQLSSKIKHHASALSKVEIAFTLAIMRRTTMAAPLRRFGLRPWGLPQLAAMGASAPTCSWCTCVSTCNTTTLVSNSEQAKSTVYRSVPGSKQQTQP